MGRISTSGGWFNLVELLLYCLLTSPPLLGLQCIYSVGFKSPATISQSQTTAQYDGTEGQLAARGRHDPCVVPRAVPIVEAMASLVVMDALMLQGARVGLAARLPPVTTLPPTMVMPGRIQRGGE